MLVLLSKYRTYILETSNKVSHIVRLGGLFARSYGAGNVNSFNTLPRTLAVQRVDLAKARSDEDVEPPGNVLRLDLHVLNCCF